MIDGHVQLAVGHSAIGTHDSFMVGVSGNGGLKGVADLFGQPDGAAIASTHQRGPNGTDERSTIYRSKSVTFHMGKPTTQRLPVMKELYVV
jgi:hypothetical protein